MNDKDITYDNVADALINFSENFELCDSETAKGFVTSKKKDILKSQKDNSFSKFTN